jgi:S-(hydroxymethyl)mycothiol dehydrogenase
MEEIRSSGVVVRRPGDAPRVEEIVIAPPGPGEVLVRVLASGVCHTDLHAQQGQFGRQFPYLLGHEASGIVERVGEGVQRPRVGETVMLCWRAPCGHCDFCSRGKLELCREPLVAKPRMQTADGLELGRVLGLGTFARHTVVAASQAIPCDPELSQSATSLIGCSVATGVGAALWSAGVRAGSTVAVFGCGAVGLSVVQGARLARAKRIFAVDRVVSKLASAEAFGATDAIDASACDAVSAIRDATGGGVDFAFEAVGLPETLTQAFASCALAGTCTLIGVPHPKAEVQLSLATLFYRRLTVRATFYGDCLPARDFPLLADWYRRGELRLDEMVSETIVLEQVEEAFERMRRGETIRSVIRF